MKQVQYVPAKLLLVDVGKTIESLAASFLLVDDALEARKID